MIQPSPYRERVLRCFRIVVVGLAIVTLIGTATAAPRDWTVGARRGDSESAIHFKEGVRTTSVFARRRINPVEASWLERALPNWLSLDIDATVSRIEVDDDEGTLVAIGPVLTWRPVNTPIFVSLGSQPGLLSDYTIAGKQLGGPFQFTSHIAVGLILDQRFMVGLRLHHTSNAAIYRLNDGLDVQSVEVALRF